MDESQNRDEFFMSQALDEARKALEQGEIPIGAVVVCGDRTVGRGHNLSETLSDATAHAEMQALTAATGALDGKYLTDCRLYVTVEPCAMCAGACFWTQVGEVIFGASDPKRGASRHQPTLYHPRTKIRGGVLEMECGALVQQFFSRLRR